MRILHILYSMKYGGIETMLVNIANEQVNHSDTYIICINDLYDQELLELLDKRVKLIIIRRPVGSRNPWYVLKMNYLIWKIKPDVIHSHNPSIVDNILPYLRKNTCLTVHSTPISIHFKYASKYSKVFAISEFVQKSLNEGGVLSSLITNGIDISHFHTKEKIQSSQEIFNIVQVGRLVMNHKGQDLLINAAKELVNRGITRFHIDFIGDGENLDYLEDMVNKYDLNSYVSFLGAKDPRYIAEHLKCYSLFVQPSRFEGFGLTVAEAMAAKVSVLVSNQEGPMEIIKNGEYGFYFENEDYHDLANKIEYIMEYEGLNVLTEKAYSYVARKYSVKNTAKEYLQQYISLSLTC